MSTSDPSAHADAVYVHAVGRSMKRLSRRRVGFVVAAVVSVIFGVGFAVGFLLNQIANG